MSARQITLAFHSGTGCDPYRQTFSAGQGQIPGDFYSAAAHTIELFFSEDGVGFIDRDLADEADVSPEPLICKVGSSGELYTPDGDIVSLYSGNMEVCFEAIS